MDSRADLLKTILTAEDEDLDSDQFDQKGRMAAIKELIHRQKKHMHIRKN
jgi:hypothetical protein